MLAAVRSVSLDCHVLSMSLSVTLSKLTATVAGRVTPLCLDHHHLKSPILNPPRNGPDPQPIVLDKHQTAEGTYTSHSC